VTSTCPPFYFSWSIFYSNLQTINILYQCPRNRIPTLRIRLFILTKEYPFKKKKKFARFTKLLYVFTRYLDVFHLIRLHENITCIHINILYCMYIVPTYCSRLYYVLRGRRTTICFLCLTRVRYS